MSPISMPWPSQEAIDAARMHTIGRKQKKTMTAAEPGAAGYTTRAMQAEPPKSGGATQSDPPKPGGETHSEPPKPGGTTQSEPPKPGDDATQSEPPKPGASLKTFKK